MDALIREAGVFGHQAARKLVAHADDAIGFIEGVVVLANERIVFCRELGPWVRSLLVGVEALQRSVEGDPLRRVHE